MIILNERLFIQDCLDGKFDVVKNKFSRLKMLKLLAIYFNCNEEKIKASMKKMYGDVFMIEQWQSQINTIMKNQLNEQCLLLEHDFIEIFEEDLEKIKNVKNEKLEKVLFTAIALAKFQNKQGWIGLYSSRDIKHLFDAANVKVSPCERYLMIGQLEEMGYFIGSKANNNINEKVEYFENGKTAMRITSFINLGNQYLHKVKNGYKMCTCCGKMYKINEYDRCSKYCKKCRLIMKNSKV